MSEKSDSDKEREYLIKRTDERLEFASTINRFSDVEYFEAMLKYLRENQ